MASKSFDYERLINVEEETASILLTTIATLDRALESLIKSTGNTHACRGASRTPLKMKREHHTSPPAGKLRAPPTPQRINVYCDRFIQVTRALYRTHSHQMCGA